MHSAHRSAVRRTPTLTAVLAAGALFGWFVPGCGTGEDPKADLVAKTPVAVPSKTETMQSAEGTAAPVAPAGGLIAVPEGDSTSPTDGIHTAAFSLDPAVAVSAEKDYEASVNKPLVATFPSEEGPDVPRPKVENLPSDDELLGRPLVIDDVVVPFDEIKRQVCKGAIGQGEVEQQKLVIFIDEEVQRRLKAGATKEQVGVDEAEMEAMKKDLEEEIKQEFPEGDVGMDDLLSSLSTTEPMERLKVQKLFEKLFLPDNPELFPPLTTEALLKQQGGQSVIDHYKETWDEKQKDPTPKTRDIAQRQFDSAIEQQVAEYLLETAKIETDPAPGVLYRVNGVDIKTEDIWNRIRPLITTMEVRFAKQWITNSRLLKDALVEAKAWLTDEEAEAAYHTYSDPYKESIFSIERLALVVKHFPSVERYKEYRRFYESFKRMKAAEMTPEALEKQAQFRTNKVVGQVSVDVDVLLCAAYDFKTNRWKENGWQESEDRMKDVLRQLVDEQKPWEVLVERYSDWYEPPTPLSQRGQIDPDQPHKGRFRNAQRNNLLAQLGESEYDQFLNGTSITDFIFFEQEPGTLGTPMRGPIGWYLPRLIRRSKPPQRLQVDPNTMKELVSDDYVQWNLNRWAQELIGKHKVYGLEYPK